VAALSRLDQRLHDLGHDRPIIRTNIANFQAAGLVVLVEVEFEEKLDLDEVVVARPHCLHPRKHLVGVGGQGPSSNRCDLPVARSKALI